MPKIIPTHINAYYADLTAAKQAAAEAEQKVAVLEEQIQGMGHPLPNKDGSFPEPEVEDTASSEDTSAAEKPVEKQTRPELNKTAEEAGVKAPEKLDTKQDVKAALDDTSAEAPSHDNAAAEAPDTKKGKK